MTQTFKEHKFPIMPFIGSVYVLWKPYPEEGDWHRVIIQNPVPPNPPEPTTLTKNKNIHVGHNTYHKDVWRFMPYQKSLTIFLQTPDPNDGQKQTKYMASRFIHIYMVTKVF